MKFNESQCARSAIQNAPISTGKFFSKDKSCTFLNSQCAHPAISVAPLSTEKANILRYQFDLHSIEDLKYRILEMCRGGENTIIILEYATNEC